MKNRYYRRFLYQFAPVSLAILLISLLVFYSSCNKLKDDFDFDKLIKPSWNPEFAVPLVNSTLHISDFTPDSSNLSIVTNPDQSLSFVYSAERIFTATAGDFMDIPNQQFEFPNSINVPFLPPGVFDTIQFNETYPFLTDTIGQRIDSIFLRNGFLSISGQTNLNFNEATLRLTVPDIVSIAGGEALTIFIDLANPNGQNPVIYFDTLYDLSEYKVLLNDAQDSLQNTMALDLNIFIMGDDNPNLSPYDFLINGSLTSLEFDAVYGYFSQYQLKLSDSLEIGIFDNALSGGFNIGQGSVDLIFDLYNSIGAPIHFDADALFVESSKVAPYHVDIHLFGPDIPNEFTINSPSIDQIGETAETTLDFTQANFAAAFNISPDFLYYDLSAVTNFGGDSTDQNFMLNESAVSLDVDLAFNLFGSVADFVVEDTIALNFDENPNELDYMMFRINLTNGFPLDASAQVYFADENYLVLDSLITGDRNLLPGASVGGAPEYRVLESASKITDVMIDKSRLENIVAAKHLLFRVRLSTSDEQLVKIYEDYNIILKLGTITGLNIDTNN